MSADRTRTAKPRYLWAPPLYELTLEQVIRDRVLDYDAHGDCEGLATIDSLHDFAGHRRYTAQRRMARIKRLQEAVGEKTWHCMRCDCLVRMPKPKCSWCGAPERNHTCPDLRVKLIEEGLEVDALHGLAGQVVSMLAPQTEAPGPPLLLNLLALFGNRVGPTAGLFHAGSWHPARLYVAIVGATSIGRKGTGTNLIRGCFPGESQITSGFSTGEGLLASLQNKENEEGSPWLTFVETEFARTLRVMGRQGNNLSQMLCDLWDRGEAEKHTVTNPAKVKNAHVSIIGHITPEVLSEELKLTEIAGGLANRFLWCYSERWHILPRGGEPAIAEARKLIGSALSRASQIEEVTWTHDALRLWGDIYPEVTGRPRFGSWAQVAGRSEGQMLRLAVIYALMDGVAVITTDHLRAAEAVWNYADRVAAQLFGPGQLAERIISALAKHGGKRKTRDLCRDLHIKVERLKAELHHLELAGIVKLDTRSTGGRPTEVVALR